ncbi:MAG: DsbA family protein [Patescibacteria group bacterium]
MQRPPLPVLFLFALSALLLVIFGTLVLEDSSRGRVNGNVNLPAVVRTAPEVTIVDPARGGNGPIIVVFGDYQCSYCQALEPELTAVMAAQPDVRVVWKNLPIRNQHPFAQTAAEAALCAGRQGRYFDMHDILMRSGPPADVALYGPLADEAGVDADALLACIASGAMKPYIDRTVDEAFALGVDGVPYLFVGDRRFSGAVSADEILNALAAAR